MGFKQTDKHISGKNSYHQIGVFTGQPMGAFNSFDDLLKFLGKQTNADGVEIGSWILDLARALTDEGAKEYAKELYALLQSHNLEIFSLATHLQAQSLGDRTSAKHLQFFAGNTYLIGLYESWRDSGNTPPEDDPNYIPPHIAEAVQKQALEDQLAACRLAYHFGKLNGRRVPVSSFSGSAGLWEDVFRFPPHVTKIGKIKFKERVEQAYDVVVRRFSPIWDLHKELDVKWGIESHPTELAAGDEESTARFLFETDRAGYGNVVGLNFDASHLVWQNVCPLSFIRRFGEKIWSVHHKGVRVASHPTTAGILGGYLEFGDTRRAWDFVFAGSKRDATNPEAILTELKRVGFDGAITLECEDNDFEMKNGLNNAAETLRETSLAPAGFKFDDAFSQATKAT